MPIPTPFHTRTSDLCTSLLWKDWAGYHAVCSYDTSHELEYFALRHAAGLIDVTPLFKYEVRGPDAAALLSRAMVRDIGRLGVGRVAYVCWCDDAGKVIDDGTVSRLDPERFRVTAADPSLAWFQDLARRLRVSIDDRTDELAALALQGPRSHAVLAAACDPPLAELRFFRVASTRLAGVPVEVSRTGYTGDLGYEVWVPAPHALQVWDALIDAGAAHQLTPVGLDALDVARIEAGFVMNGVDYVSAQRCLLESRKVSPYELGLGRIVELDRGPFVGREALRREHARGPLRARVGLAYDWDDYERLFAAAGLPPQVPPKAWRTATPVYDRRGRHVGHATSGAWSPLLKRSLALAQVEAACARPGTRLRVELQVDFRRREVEAAVVELPFFDPPRKRA